jgi:hypothetical protein
MAAPTTVTFTFSGGPQTVTIPNGIDYSQYIRNVYLAGDCGTRQEVVF